MLGIIETDLFNKEWLYCLYYYQRYSTIKSFLLYYYVYLVNRVSDHITFVLYLQVTIQLCTLQ